MNIKYSKEEESDKERLNMQKYCAGHYCITSFYLIHQDEPAKVSDQVINLIKWKDLKQVIR